ncbi:MAG: sodium-translocating pyrophosphatase [Syntrophothermus sp.]|uniref:sodium-translocating pyrophosphatase n=1 Tax=Syntrophothermus sp. TaxID=2736299 RepID=UPI00257A45BE|nr:sodium-translocating pyrophosphatase [Syntrophothermus sp.]NSW84068.1 sodium-translocating pyrophosphatase [Syntrophothermus sp.]
MDVTAIIPVSGIFALLFVAYLTWSIFKMDRGTADMQNVADAIREGAYAFLRRQYGTIMTLAVVVAVLLYFVTSKQTVGPEGKQVVIGYRTALAFFLGATCSAIAGFIGMYVAVNSNIRAAAGALRSFPDSLKASFRGGAVTGLAVTALSLLGVWGLFTAYGGRTNPEIAPLLIVGYGFGASFVALFAQLGGGIYTKAADVGADIVGKVEAGIPEDDPRNPAVVADLVGDNVGDCAGRGADLFESTAAENIGAMVLGIALYPVFGVNGLLFPLVARAFGIIASIIGIMCVRGKENEDPMWALNRGYFVTTLFCVIFLYYVVNNMLTGVNPETGQAIKSMNFFWCAIIGVALSYIFVLLTQYYTDIHFRPVKEIAKACTTGPATTIIQGTAVGMESVALPVIFISAAIYGAYTLGATSGLGAEGGLYGTAVATMGMLSTCAFILAMDTFGPITDNAGGIAEMSGAPETVRLRTDRLDACGNTCKALTKGYAIGSAALATFLLFRAYLDEVVIKVQALPAEKIAANPELQMIGKHLPVDIGNVKVFIGAFVALMLVFLFSSTAIRAVGNAAQSVIIEVRRQFREIPGLMEGKAKPEYGRCVDIVTARALKEMVLPGMLVVVTPILVGILLGPAAAAAFLMVGTIGGVVVALYLNNGGGAWDNAKKLIELGHYGGKGSEAHAAGVVGDTVGDPFKDTAGPSLHVLVKLISTITLVLVGSFFMFI